MSTLSERRKGDLEIMASIIVGDVRGFGRGFTAEIDDNPPLSPRAIWVRIATPEGLQLTVDFDGQSTQPDTHVLSWHSATGATFKLSPSFAPSVNSHHWHKATDICEGFTALRETINARLRSVIDKTAFQ